MPTFHVSSAAWLYDVGYLGMDVAVPSIVYGKEEEVFLILSPLIHVRVIMMAQKLYGSAQVLWSSSLSFRPRLSNPQKTYRYASKLSATHNKSIFLVPKMYERWLNRLRQHIAFDPHLMHNPRHPSKSIKFIFMSAYLYCDKRAIAERYDPQPQHTIFFIKFLYPCNV